jgi:hypothetical protein
LADIADTNFFETAQDLSDEFYPTDLFWLKQKAAKYTVNAWHKGILTGTSGSC